MKKGKDPVPSLRGASANILSLRGALATKQSRFRKRGIKGKDPVPSLRGALATKQSRFRKRGIKDKDLVIAYLANSELHSFFSKGEFKDENPAVAYLAGKLNTSCPY